MLTLAASSVAMADQPYRGGHEPQRAGRDHGWQDRGGYGHRDSDRRGWGDRRGLPDRHDWRGGYYGYGAPRGYSYPAPRSYYAPRGYYGHRWSRGEWLPPVYRTRYYYMPDYRRYGYRVYAPPVGCGWVRHDGDLLLTALATGLVLDVIYDAYD
jgi:Ni/Co efflux regulator RcnB